MERSGSTGGIERDPAGRQELLEKLLFPSYDLTVREVDEVVGCLVPDSHGIEAHHRGDRDMLARQLEMAGVRMRLDIRELDHLCNNLMGLQRQVTTARMHAMDQAGLNEVQEGLNVSLQLRKLRVHNHLKEYPEDRVIQMAAEAVGLQEVLNGTLFEALTIETHARSFLSKAKQVIHAPRSSDAMRFLPRIMGGYRQTIATSDRRTMDYRAEDSYYLTVLRTNEKLRRIVAQLRG